ncbi:MAG TPA: nuclear transport factor 2 family protein [Usitatibacter sp.]
MRHASTPIALLLAPLLAACASSPSAPLDAAASLAAAETEFAALSVREDMRAAFLANFADDGVYVRDGWVVAKTDLAKRSAPAIVLDWRPAFTEVARSGDLGLSTGPWKITSKAKPGEPPSFGQFVSIWRRDPGGPWKVAVDIGIAHPGAALWDQALATVVLPGRAALPRGGIETAELEFVTDAHQKGLPAAYAAYGSERFRFYRDGFEPAVGKANAIASPAMTGEKLAWSIDQIEMSQSREFGYSRGSYAAVATPKTPLGYFMRVWHVEDGQWRIALDVANPVAKP